MDKNEIQQLAQKYLDGRATDEEKKLLHEWYDTTDAGWVETVNTDVPETEEQIKQRIFDNLQQRKSQERELAERAVKPTFGIRRLVLQVASAAAVIAMVFFAWRYNTQPALVADKQLVNVPGNKVIQLTLPDGSKVWLNAGSVFKYPKQFNAKVREVELLEGRAFFDVRHETKHPFVVKTKNLNVTVLGTSFDVRSYGREGTTKVSVVTGKVGITVPNQPNKPAIFPVAKQQVVLSKATNQITKAVVHEAVINLWCKNPLVFEQEQLSNVFSAIEKKYNTKIIVENKELLNEQITIVLGNQRLDTIMETLSFTKHFNYKMANDSTVVIK